MQTMKFPGKIKQLETRMKKKILTLSTKTVQ